MNRLRPLALAAVLLLALAIAPQPALAEDAPDLCVDRPGTDTPPCTVAAGRIMVEFGALGWEHSAAPGMRDDTLTFGDTLARIGLGHATELQIGFGGWSHQRSRSGNSVATAHGAGDASFGLRHGFGSEADAKVAVQAFVSLPVGRAPGGAGDWGAGLLVPIALPLPAGFSIAVTPEIAAAVNGSGHGRHVAWGAAAGLSHALTSTVSASVEATAYRDEDPDGGSTDSRLALSAAWHAGRALQLDIELDTGLTHGAPDHALLIGFARQF